LTAGIRLIVGLGNPTARYEQTRHNAGFWFLDRMAHQLRVALRCEPRFQGVLGRCDGSKPLFLLKPLTYMNRSGQSVAAVASYYKIGPSEILVAHDELDLMPGAVRMKKGGGHGGHNGLRDLIAHLGTADFYRLRFGIGHPGERSAVVNYVLAPPSLGDAALLDEAMTRALAEVAAIVHGEFAQVMNRLHAADRERKKDLT
jgi:PTH1 family peptidyl-tRNA hydrolase